MFSFFNQQHHLSWLNVMAWIGTFFLLLLLSSLLVVLVIISLPADYFTLKNKRLFLVGQPRLVYWSALILKNAAGLFLFCIGIALLILPGQGVLTMLLGLLLMDIPGKRPVETRLVTQPAVFRFLNRIRKGFNKPPFVTEHL